MSQIAAVTPKPHLRVRIAQNHWHAIMNWFQQPVGFRCDEKRVLVAICFGFVLEPVIVNRLWFDVLLIAEQGKRFGKQKDIVWT